MKARFLRPGQKLYQITNNKISTLLVESVTETRELERKDAKYRMLYLKDGFGREGKQWNGFPHELLENMLDTNEMFFNRKRARHHCFVSRSQT